MSEPTASTPNTTETSRSAWLAGLWAALPLAAVAAVMMGGKDPATVLPPAAHVAAAPTAAAPAGATLWGIEPNAPELPEALPPTF
jgi:hypothetical protein